MFFFLFSFTTYFDWILRLKIWVRSVLILWLHDWAKFIQYLTTVITTTSIKNTCVASVQKNIHYQSLFHPYDDTFHSNRYCFSGSAHGTSCHLLCVPNANKFFDVIILAIFFAACMCNAFILIYSKLGNFIIVSCTSWCVKCYIVMQYRWCVDTYST